MIIHVTQEDIDKGTPVSCAACPVALALKRYFPEYNHIVAGPTRLLLGTNEDNYAKVKWRAVTPGEVQTFMTDFDRSKRDDQSQPPQPFKFQVVFTSEYPREN